MSSLASSKKKVKGYVNYPKPFYKS